VVVLGFITYMEPLLMILLLLVIQQDVADLCFVYLSNSSVPAHHSSVVSQMISVISHCIHIRSSYTWYLWEMMQFFATHAKLCRYMNYHFSVHETTINDVTDVHKCSGCANLARYCIVQVLSMTCTMRTERGPYLYALMYTLFMVFIYQFFKCYDQ